MKDADEGAHMGHPDFRVNGRIFATIHPDPTYGMVKLTPEQQQEFIRDHPAVFAPEKIPGESPASIVKRCLNASISRKDVDGIRIAMKMNLPALRLLTGFSQRRSTKRI